MTRALSMLEALGAASLPGLWAPVLAWTALAGIAALALRQWGARAPEAAYRLAQAALFALPVGLAVSLLIDPTWLPAMRTLPTPLVAAAPAPAAGPALTPVVPDVGPSVSVLSLIGLATLVAGAVGVVALVRLGRQALALRRLRRSLPVAASDGLADAAAEAAARAGLRRAPDVLVTSADVVPMTLGAWRPLVVLPASLDGAGRRLALAHEFHHVRQRDALAQWGEALTAAVFAAHPVAGMLARQCDLFREMACDAAVLADSAADRHLYAALVSSFATAGRPRWSPPAIGMADRIPHVHQRLLAMTRSVASAPRFAGVSALAVLVAGVLLMTAGRAVAQPARAVAAEGAAVTVMYVDGERVEGSFEDLGLAPDAIYSIEVVQGEKARSAHGADRVVRVTTRAAAEAAGLPARDGVTVRSDGGSSEARARGVDPERGITVYRQGAEEYDDTASIHIEGESSTVEVTTGSAAPPGEPGIVVRRRAGAEGSAQADRVIFIDGVIEPDATVEALDVDEIQSIEVRTGVDLAEYGASGVGSVLWITTKAAAQGAPAAPSAEAPTAEARAAGAPALAVSGVRPNPSQDAVEIGLAAPAAGDVRVEVFDVTGRLVQTVTRSVAPGASSVALDVSGLAPGGYVVRVRGAFGGRTQEATAQITVAR